MDRKQRPRRRRIGAGLVVFLAALCAAPVTAQTPRVEPQPVPVGDSFRVVFRLERSFERVDLVEPSYPDLMRRRTGPTIRTVLVEDETGRNRPRTEIGLDFEALRAGRAVVGPFAVQTEEGRVDLGSILVQVSFRESPDVVPFSVRWSTPVVAPYVGQTFPVVLELVDVTETFFPDRIDTSEALSGTGRVFQEADGLGRVSVRRVGENRLFSVPVAGFLVTPTAAGSLAIGEASVEYRGITAVAPPARLTVRGLPPGLGETGAVGRFQLREISGPTAVPVGREFSISVRIEGEGNLDFLQLPDPTIRGAGLIGKSEDSVLIPAESGYRGSRTVAYRLVAPEPGEVRVEFPLFRWLDPYTGEVSSARLEPLVLSAAAEGRQTSATVGFGGLAEPLPGDEVFALDRARLYASPAAYLLFLPGPIFFLVVVLLRRRNPLFFAFGLAIVAATALLSSCSVQDQDVDRHLEEARVALEEGDNEAAFRAYEALMELRPASAGLRYNAAVVALRLDRLPDAVQLLRESIRLNPASERLRTELALLESAAGLDQQVPPPQTIHPDLIFLIFVPVVNLLFLLFAVRLRRRQAVRIIGIVLGAAVATGLAITLAVAADMQGREVAVVASGGASVKRIPDEQAEEWLVLPEGTAVHRGVRTAGFLLVRTGYGVEGWVPEGRLVSRQGGD